MTDWTAAASSRPPSLVSSYLSPRERSPVRAGEGFTILALAVSAVLMGGSAVAEETPARVARIATTVNFDIAPQELASALNQLALQSREQLISSAELTRGMYSSGVRGELTTEQALSAILTGTGLTYEKPGKGAVYVLKRQRGSENTRSYQPARAETFRLAQATSTGPASPASAAASAGNSGDVSVETVTVTGSRIARNEFESPTPVTAVDAATIERSGFSNLSDVLLRTPVVGVGLGSANSYYNNDAGASFINLRGLGTERTLVLVNGRRRVSGTALSSAVDISTIPANMIERVEVITGGAAAVYGADAVTGVVNIILKNDVEGVEFDGRVGTSEEGGGDSYTASLLFGGDIGEDRGKFTFGVSYNQEGELMASERDFGRRQIDLFANPDNGGPNDGIFDQIAVENYRYPNTSYGGAFTVGGVRYTVDPTLRPTRNDQTPYGPTGFLGVGGDGFNDADFAPLRTELKVLSTLGHLEYDLTDDVTFFTDLQFANTRSVSPRQPTFDFDMMVGRDNPFLPTAVAALMDANALDEIAVSRTNWDHGAQRAEIERNTFTVVSGVNGRIFDRFDWTAFGQYGRYESTLNIFNDRINSRFQQALDVEAGPGGVAQCADAAARAAGCAPLNILGPNAATPEALAFFTHTQVGKTTNTQVTGGAQLTGALFDLPAGELQLASGVEYRKETLSTQQDGLAVVGDLFAGAGVRSVDADYDVKEAFVEVLAPVLRDQPFAQSLTVEAAARYSDYNTIGSTTAWKGGVQWAPISDARLRVTRSQSVRAPSLTELFNPGSQANEFIIDPCNDTLINTSPTRLANCRALGIPVGYTDPAAGFTKTTITGGNANLSEETSDSWTVGVVLTPTFLRSFTASIDYWKIEIDDAVSTIAVDRIVNGCVDASSLDNEFCSFITRGDDLAITTVNISPINIGELSAEGIDFQAAYRLDDIGLSFGLAGTYLMELRRLVDADDPLTLQISEGEVDNPRFRANLTTAYALGDSLSLNWALRYISATKVDRQALAETRSDNNAGSRIYNDLYARYGFGTRYSVYGGINNVLDESPPKTRDTFQGTGRGALYDNIGRYFFVGAGARF